MVVPAGVVVTDLDLHPDERGAFSELFRAEWGTGVDPVQWNVVTSEPGVLRGVHVHPRHDDYFTVVAGHATVALRDLRRSSPTEGLAMTIEGTGAGPRSIVIPHGVAHGFLFHERSTHVYAVTHYWDTADELACHWDDPDLAIEWPFRPTLLSERDATAPPLKDLLAELESFQPF